MPDSLPSHSNSFDPHISSTWVPFSGDYSQRVGHIRVSRLPPPYSLFDLHVLRSPRHRPRIFCHVLALSVSHPHVLSTPSLTVRQTMSIMDKGKSVVLQQTAPSGESSRSGIQARPAAIPHKHSCCGSHSHDSHSHDSHSHDSHSHSHGAHSHGFHSHGCHSPGLHPHSQGDEVGENEVINSPAFIIEWNGEVCIRTDLPTPEDMSSAIKSFRQPPTNGKSVSSMRRLLVLQGLPANYLQALFHSSLDIDPKFIDAHTQRRTCHPMNNYQDGTHSFMHWTYPELVQRDDSATTEGPDHWNGLNGNAQDQEAYPVGTKKGALATIFRRASLWSTGELFDVLLLDKPARREVHPQPRKPHRSTTVTASSSTTSLLDGSQMGVAGPSRKQAHTDKVTSLGDTLYEHLRNVPKCCDIGIVADILAGVVYGHWMMLFEVLAPPTTRISLRDTIQCCWKMLHYLEQNAGATPTRAHSHNHTSVGSPDWNHLLSRLNQRITLLSIPTHDMKSPAHIDVVVPQAAIKSSRMGSRQLSSVDTLPSAKCVGKRIPVSSIKSLREPQDENQRALDRISYLGGILLPLPIVSGILSMGDTFGPTGSKFFIFWATAVPLSVLAVVIIYADIIRKAEVWVEATSEQGTTETGGSPAKDDKSKGWGCVMWWRHKGKKEEASGMVDEEAPKSPDVRPDGDADETGNANTGQGAEGEDIAAPEVEFPVLISLGVGHGQLEMEQPELRMRIVEQRTDSVRNNTWKRQQLGWYGAAKAIVYRKPRYCTGDGPPETPSLDGPRRKTKTY